MNKAATIASRVGFGVLASLYLTLAFAFAYTFI